MNWRVCVCAVVVTGAGLATAGPEPVVETDDRGFRAVAIVDGAGDADGEGGELDSGGADLPAPEGTEWMPLGPFGGDVENVAASPTAPEVALAGIAPAGGTGGTLFRSTDGGATWDEVSDLSDTSVFDVEFDPAGIAYIGTIDGVWRSTDDGATWTQLDLGIGANDQVFDVSLDPNDSTTIWAGVADAIGNQPANVLRSTDSGSTWQDVTPPQAPISGRSIAIDPSDSDNIVAAFGGAFGGGAVWVSDDGGATWTNRSAGLPSGSPVNVAVHTGSRILVGGGQAFGSQFLGLFESTDGGATWDRLDTPDWPGALVNDVGIDPSDPDTVLVASVPGVHRSTDGGSTWSVGVPGTASLSMNSVRFAPGSSSDVLAGASSIGVLRSGSGGEQFEISSTGIGALNVVDVEANPGDPQEIALAFQGLNDGGVQSSTDGGQSWTLEATPGTRWNTVGWDADGTLYALSDGPSSIAPEGLYRRESDDSWTQLGPDQGNLFESELFGLFISRNDPDLILVGGNDFGVAGFEPTIWRSTDRGGTWTKVFEGEEDVDDFKSVMDIEFVQDGTDMIGLAAFDDTSQPQEGGVFRSTDGGVTWAESSNGLPEGVKGVALAPSPTDINTFFLADNDFGQGNGGVHVTTDAGQTWASTGFVQQLLDLAADQNDDQVLYALQFSDPKVLRSDDQGATFSAFDEGLGLAGASRSLTFVDAPRPRLLMSSGTGVFARDLPTPPCPADLTGPGGDGVPDGALTSDDFFFYLGLFADGDLAADLTGPGGDGVPDGALTSDDFFFYLGLFAAGCP